jgi:hypothetical protein
MMSGQSTRRAGSERPGAGPILPMAGGCVSHTTLGMNAACPLPTMGCQGFLPSGLYEDPYGHFPVSYIRRIYWPKVFAPGSWLHSAGGQDTGYVLVINGSVFRAGLALCPDPTFPWPNRKVFVPGRQLSLWAPRGSWGFCVPY